MRATLFLLRRYLLPRQGNLLSFALWISVGGVALGIIQLMLVLSVMSGFQGFLQKSYTRITSDLIVLPAHNQLFDDSYSANLGRTEGVAAVSPFELGQAMVMKDGVGGVVLEGIDFATSGKVTPWEEIWVEKPDLAYQASHSYWIWLGVQLAKKLKVKIGDSVNVFLADQGQKKIIPFRVTGITKFGIYDHDMRYARVDLKVVNEIFKRFQMEPMYKVRLRDGAIPAEVMQKLIVFAGSPRRVKQWSDLNQNIFLAVAHQKKLLFLILEIIVALAAINVINLLVMSSYQRRRDIAILRAMGMGLTSVFSFFVLQGTAVGVVGISVGTVVGYGVCRLVERFQPTLLSESVYNVTRLPIRVEWTDVAWISGVALALCVLFSVLPALRAAFTRPVKALRYE